MTDYADDLSYTLTCSLGYSSICRPPVCVCNHGNMHLPLTTVSLLRTCYKQNIIARFCQVRTQGLLEKTGRATPCQWKINWRPTLSIRITALNVEIFGQTFFSTLRKSCLVFNEFNL